MTELMDVNPPATPPVTTDAPASEPSTESKWHGEDFASIVESKGWKSPDDALKGYENLEKLKGMPEFAKYMSDIPESVDGYKYEFKGEGESPINDELKSQFFAWAHEKKYPNSFISDAIDFQLDAIKAGDEMYATQQAERKSENIDTMKQKWQNDYEPTITKIDATAEKLGVKAYFESLGIDKEPEVVNMLLTIANSDSEDKLETTEHTEPRPTTLQDKLQEIMASDAYNQRFHKDHKETMQRFMDLNMEIANAGQQQAPA